MQLVVALMFVLAVCAIPALSQPPRLAEANIFEQAYLAKDDGGNPGAAATEFAVNDVPIHCVVLLSSSSPVTVKMDLIAVSVPGLRPESKIISTSYTTKDMQDRVFFNGRPSKVWFVGGYRADIYIDGNLVGKFPFTVKGSAAPTKPDTGSQPKQPVKPRQTTAKRT